jgi:predicted negative regulator of RcsB-dependent stress response
MQNQEIKNTGDRNKIYFLVVVIAALLGINAYLYFKNKQDSGRFTTVNTEKDRLKLEVEKIEVELDKLNAFNQSLSQELLKEQDFAREKIAELKAALVKGEMTKTDLANAQIEIKNLRDFVNNYSSQISRLENENAYLKTERDSFKNTSEIYTEKTQSLQKENENLTAKVKIGAALKASNISIQPFKIKNNNKNIPVTKASLTNILNISFNIVPNTLAEKDYHKVYLRVFDPSGNLVAKEENVFEIEGQQMQYSGSIEFIYNNDNSAYKILFENPNGFIKGKYSIILYADGYIMGKSEIILK